MKITDYLRRWLNRDEQSVLVDWQQLQMMGGFRLEERLPFSKLIFYNICDLLTDIANETKMQYRNGDLSTYVGLSAFFDAWGKYCLNAILECGYVVIGKTGDMFHVMTPNDYTQMSDTDSLRLKPKDPNTILYIMKSQTFQLYQCSDKDILKAWLKYLDNVMNSSNTATARLGAMVVMSPENAPSAQTTATLNEEQKKRLEESISESYGSLNTQKQVLLLTKSMRTQVVNLSGLDQRTMEKAKLAILAICDRIKVPANQVAIIDAQGSKSLSNGTELREGDLAKYRSFRRLMNATFWQMAEDFGVSIDYVIENEPKTTQGDDINEAEKEI